MDSEKIKRKFRLIYIWLTIMAITNVVIFIFMMLDVEPFDMKESSYVGVLVTIMGIIFAVGFGYQVFNSVEFRDQLKTVMKSNEELSRIREEMNNSYHRAFAYSICTRAIIAMQDDYVSSAKLFLMSIREFISDSNPLSIKDDIKIAISNLDKVLSAMNDKQKSDNCNILNQLAGDIIQHEHYKVVREEFQPIKTKLSL